MLVETVTSSSVPAQLYQALKDADSHYSDSKFEAALLSFEKSGALLLQCIREEEKVLPDDPDYIYAQFCIENYRQRHDDCFKRVAECRERSALKLKLK